MKLQLMEELYDSVHSQVEFDVGYLVASKVRNID